MQYRPTEAEVQKVMKDTGMNYLQAYRHLQQRHQLASLPNSCPLGKSAHFA
jgi:hypothetical protein